MRSVAALPAVLLALAAAPAALAHTPREVPAGEAQRVVSGDRVTAVAHGDVLPDRPREAEGDAPVSASSTATGLASDWCGTRRGVDDVEHSSSTGPRVKLVYAHPADEPDRFDAVADLLQSDARSWSQTVAASAGGVRTLRFDTGTDCGPGHLDLLYVKLPRPRSEYLSGTVGERMRRILADVAPATDTVGGTSNVLVFAERTYAGDGVSGVAYMYGDDRPGAENVHNAGGLEGIVFGTGAAEFASWRRSTGLHELTHTLGAVQDGAPNATGAGHCADEWDVMCYDDGGPGALMRWPCLSEVYDCGGDDYISAAPLSGSYLAGHWNLFDSAFLCAVGECVAPDEAPTAALSPSAAGDVTAGTRVTFDGSASRDAEAPIASWSWDLDGDGGEDATGPTAAFTYAQPGDHRVRLTVRDRIGQSAVATHTVRVVPAPAPAAPASPPAASTPAAPPPAAPPRAPAPALGEGRDGAGAAVGEGPAAWPTKLEVARLRVRRSTRELDVLAPITRRASGEVEVDFHAAGRHERFAAAVDAREGHVRLRHPLKRDQARLGTGIVTLSYGGDPNTRPQEVRLRAAGTPARLDAERPSLRDGRLRAAGTLTRRARGVVRIALEWTAGGELHTHRVRARVRDGRWSVTERLPATVRDALAQRTGDVHSYIAYTGQLRGRIRGEMASFQVASH